MAKLTALSEREIDAPLRWTESSTNRGGAPAGYDSQTRIRSKVICGRTSFSALATAPARITILSSGIGPMY